MRFSPRGASCERVSCQEGRERKPGGKAEQVLTSGKNTVYSMTQAQRLKRVFAIEIEKCGGKVEILASIEDPDVIEKILKHLGLDEASQARNRSPPAVLF